MTTTTNIVLDLITNISAVPGVMGLTSLEFDKPVNILNEKNAISSIQIKKDEEQNDIISSSIVVSSELPTKTIIKEIVKVIKLIYKNNEKAISNILIYIRGVK